jgi:fermentation-respiration switch protein FrsA (DUF1100 family)
MAGLVSAGLTGAAAIGVGAGAAVLYAKTVPRPKGTDQAIIDEFADTEKMAEYATKMGYVGEWAEAMQFEDLYVTSNDGLRLHALYLPAETTTGRLVIIHHGYTSNATHNFAHAYFFHERGYDVLLLDLRAHGQSEGECVGFGILERFDTLAWIQEMRRRLGEELQIVLHGTSMGATTVLMALGVPEIKQTVSAVIADCAYTSPAAIFSHVMKKNYHVPVTTPIIKACGVISNALAGYDFEDYSTLEALRDNHVPVLLIHGKEDKFVPTWMSEENYEACHPKKRLLMVENAGHGSSIFENRELYERTEREFLEEVGL